MGRRLRRCDAAVRCRVLFPGSGPERPGITRSPSYLARMFGSKNSWALLPLLLTGGMAGCQMPIRSSALVGAEAAPLLPTPGESLEVRVWRAGRTLPPGLSITRAAEMEAARARAAAELARTLRPGDLQRLADWLSADSTALERWSAAARCVVVLEAYELAALVARGLDPGAGSGRAASARTTLHAL